MSLTSDNIGFDKLIISEIAQVRAYDRADSSFLFEFDQPKEGTLEGSNDTIFAEGKNGVRLAAFDRNKQLKFNCTNGYVVGSALAFQMGSELYELSSENTATVRKHEEVVAVAKDAGVDTVTLEGTPVTDSIKYIYALNSDGTPGIQYPVASQASASAFSVSNGIITLPTGTVAGDKFIVPYDETVSVGKKIINSGGDYAGSVRLVIDLLCTHPCDGTTFLAQCTIPNAKVSGNFSFAFGSDPTVHNFEAEAMLDTCSSDKQLAQIVMA